MLSHPKPLEVALRENPHSSTISSRHRDFTKMNSVVYFGYRTTMSMWKRFIRFSVLWILMKMRRLSLLHTRSRMWLRYVTRCGEMADHQEKSSSLGTFSKLHSWSDSFLEIRERIRLWSSSTYVGEVCQSSNTP